MKKIFTIIALCSLFAAGCDSTTVTPEKIEQLLAEVSGDSVSTTGTGGAFKTSTVSSTSLDFTNADSMRIQVTFWGSTNNTAPNAIRIGYIFSISPDSNVYVYNIPNSSVVNSETTVDVTMPSPNVNKSFIYNLNYINADGLGGVLRFKDLKIYKK